MLAFALLALALLPLDGALGDWLVRAASADGAERERAQRWLATHLEERDAAELAARAASGDAELRERLARAIGGEPHLVGLAARLALGREPAASQLGREALREQILEWDPGAEGDAGEALDWLFELRSRAPERLALDAQENGLATDAWLDLVVRRASVVPPLVLDPRARESRAPSTAAAPLEGTISEILLEGGAARGLSLRAYGFTPGDEARPWIVYAPRTAPRASALEFTTGFVLGAADPELPAEERAANARALSGTGWPAGLAFLEQRWLGGDESALEGLLVAAGRGRVAVALADPARQRALYARLAALCADERDAAALERASRLARALSAAGPSSPAGETLGPLALEGFDQAAPRERWLRLAVLEGQGRSFPEALAAADALLASAATPAPLAIQALRVRAALAGTASRAPADALAPPADALALLDWATDARRRAELRSLWTGLALPWPEAWNGLEARGSALAPRTRALLVEIAWERGAREAGLAGARALFADRAPESFAALCDTLAELSARDPLSARTLADALPRASEAQRAHASAAALVAGLTPAPAELEWLAQLVEQGPRTAEALLALASQSAGGRGAEVRAKLVEALGAKLALEDRMAALDEAARALAEQGADAALENLASAVRERARQLADAGLRAQLRPGRWPPPREGAARPLGRSEREVGRW
ncbi:MAG: hypothetical protein IPJ19_19240 [Planctomycetes bacterium]|nr:hypothetical protein [Planctomycetota bacterium]